MHNPSIRIRCAAWLAVSTALPSVAATIPGPATFAAQADMDVLRGGFPVVDIATSDSGYKSGGATRARAAIDPVNWFSGPPTAAEAQADDFRLRALARSQGAIFNVEADVPRVQAMARATTTRFYSFTSDFAIVDLPVLLGGVLGSHLGYAELPQQAFSRVRYTFEWTDASGATLATLFDYQAQVGWTGSGFTTTRSTSGSADPTVWAASFTPTVLPDTSFGSQQAWIVGLLDMLDTPHVALAGGTYGFRWILETETLMRGYSMAGQFTADFARTADIGLGRSDAELAALGIAEVLTTPVPEPATALMWLAGLALLHAGHRGRARRQAHPGRWL